MKNILFSAPGVPILEVNEQTWKAIQEHQSCQTMSRKAPFSKYMDIVCKVYNCDKYHYCLVPFGEQYYYKVNIIKELHDS